jgi:hypothetical protein
MMKRRPAIALGFVARAALSDCAHRQAPDAGWTTLFDGGSIDAFHRAGQRTTASSAPAPSRCRLAGAVQVRKVEVKPL